MTDQLTAGQYEDHNKFVHIFNHVFIISKQNCLPVSTKHVVAMLLLGR